MVHVSRARRREIVLFGAGHELLTPVVLGGTGPILLNASTGDRRIDVSRIDLTGAPPQVLTSSTDLVEVIRTVSALGATYPQIISILESASTQANIEAELLVDAVPSDVEQYDRALLTGEDVTRKDDALSPASFEEEPGDAAERRRGLGLFRRLLPRSRPAAEESPAPEDTEVEAVGLEEVLQPAAEKRPGLFTRFRGRPGDGRP
jgi:hypothetical protein